MDFEASNAQEWDQRSLIRPEPSSVDNLTSQALTCNPGKCLDTLVAPISSHLISAPRSHQTLATDVSFKAPPKFHKYVSHGIRNKIQIEDDTPAQTAWRLRQPETDVFSLERAEASRKGILIAISRVNQSTGAFIPHPSALDKELRIWGTPAQAEKATQALNQLFAERPPRVYKSLSKVDWAKVYSPSMRKRQENQREEEQDSIKQVYIRVPDANVPYSHHGYFLWPVDETNPFDVFGRNLEALDSIRMFEECFISYKAQKAVFIIMSDFRDSVDNAISRLRCLLCEVVARSRKSFRRMMLEEIPSSDLRTFIRLVSPSRVSKQTFESSEQTFVTCHLAGSPLPPEDIKEYNHKLKTCAIMDLSKLPKSIASVLNGLRYYRGFVRMRIHFGIFGLKEYKKPIGMDHTLQEFIEMMQHPRTTGELRRDLSQQITAKALRDRIYAHTNLFVPLDPQCRNLNQTTREHSAYYNVLVPVLGPLRLQVTFREVAAGEFENFSNIWLKSSTNTEELADSRPHVSRPVDVDFIQLSTSFAWKLEVSATNVIEPSKITANMRRFAESIRLNPPRLEHAPDSLHSISAIDCIHRMTQRFILRGSDYIVELSEYVTTAACKDQIHPANKIQPSQRLEISMYQSQWDAALEPHKSLPIGIPGDWNPAFSSFFPVDDRSGVGMNELEWTAQKARIILSLFSE